MVGKYQAYPKYKDSGVEWVGYIPKDWNVKPLFSVAGTESIKNGDGAETNVLSLSYGNIIRRNIDKNYGLLPESFNTYQLVNSGDLILRLTDLQNDKRSLRVGYAKEKGIITSAYLKLKAKNGQLSDKYCYRLLHSYDTTKVFYGMGGGLRQSMKFEDMKRLSILIPTLKEQQKIANFLDHETTKIDTLIEKQQQLIKLLKEKRQAVISHAVTKGLDPNVPMRDSGVEWLGEVPEHWEEISRIKYISSLKGRQGWQGLKAEEYLDKGPYVVSSAHFINHQIQWDACPHVSLERYDRDSNIQLVKGDLLLMKDGAAMGKLAYVDELPDKACLNSHLLLFRPINKNKLPTYSSRFMYYFMQTEFFQEHIKIYGTGVTFLGISQQAIGNYRLVFPELNEQREITTFLENETSKLDELAEKQNNMMLLLQERRTALISAAVTGKIDVRNWQAPETK